MSQKFKSEVELQALNNATTDTDKFLVSDSGVVKYRTGNEVLSDLGITLNTASKLQHQVKAGVAINKGQAVYVASADGTNMIVGLASNASEATSSKTMGLLDATVAINGFANVVTEGLLDGLNTVGANAGDPVWLGTGGNLIYGLLNKPYAPAHLVFIGIVTRVNANNGEIFVKVQNGFELNEIHDVDLKTTTPVNGHVLGFDGTLWVNKTIAGWLGYTPWHPGNDGSGSGLDADLLDGYHASAFQLALTNPVTGTGTTNYVSKFTGASTLGNSQIFDNGTNVGIGTASPGGQFEVYTDAYKKFNVTYPTAYETRLSFGAAAYTAYDALTSTLKLFATYGAISLGAGAGGTERMRINSVGNVGIGTTSPSEKLHISGNTLVTGTLEVDTVNNGVGDFLTRTAVGIVTRRTAAEVRSDIGAQAALTNPVTGTGTLNFVSKFTSTGSTLGDSQIFDNGTNVGIGTSSPITKLDLGSSTGQKLSIYSSGNDRAGFGIETSTLRYYTPTNTIHSFGHLSTSDGVTFSERMQIDSNGNVGIGTSSPSALLNVYGNLHLGAYSNLSTVNIENRTAKSLLYISTDGVNNAIGSTITYTWADGGQGPLKFNNTSGEVMRLDAIGKLGVGTTAPTSRIHSVTSASGPVSFDNRCAIFGDNTAVSTVYPNSVGVAGRVLTSDGRAIYGDATTGGGWGGYFDGKGYFSGNVGIGTTSPPSKVSISGGTLSVSGSGSGYGVVKLGDPTDVNPYVGMYRSAAASIATSGNFLNLGGYDGIAFTTGAAQLSGQPERMRITSSGNVGIGTTSPVAKLEIVGNTRTSGTNANPSLEAVNTGTSGFPVIQLANTISSTFKFWNIENGRSVNGDLGFFNANGQVVTFKESGHVGIGTSTPSTLLDVNGIITAIGGNSTQWNSKQENLVSGTNIKTLNGNDVLGSGDLSTKGIHTLVKPEVGETTSFLLYGQSIGNIGGQANRLTAVPYIPATTITCSSLYINVTTALAGSNARILIYSDDNGKPRTKIYESANLDCSTTGIKTATTTQTFEAGKIYWICSHSSSTQSFSAAFPNALIPINVSAISVFTSYYITPTFGSAPTTFGTGTFIQLSIPFIGIKI